MKVTVLVIVFLLFGFASAEKNGSCQNDLNDVLNKLSQVIQPPTATATFSAVQYLQTIRNELKLLLEVYKDYQIKETTFKELVLVGKETPPSISSGPPKGRTDKLKKMIERRSRRI